MKNRTPLALTTLACGIAASVQAQSTLTWDWTYGGTLGLPASGTFTTQATTTTSTGGATGYLITGITGTWDGYVNGNTTITSILPVGNGTFTCDDLIITANPALWQVSQYGFGFNLSNGGKVEISAGSSGSGPTYGGLTSECYFTQDRLGLTEESYASNFTITLVPEPSTLALAGLGAAGLLIFRRARSANRATVGR